jgi:16S rRNA (guanine527-N7)-methyltransferase
LSTDALYDLIEAGCRALGLVLEKPVIDKLARFVTLLAKWNRVYNLTAVRTPEAMVVRHILDSLAVNPWIAGPRVLDVGTGAGLPGVPLALVRPELPWVLLDSSGKKLRFVRQAKAELGIDNIEPVNSRVQDYRPEAGFDQIISRAFASLQDMQQAAAHLLKPGGELLAMKGRVGDADIEALNAPEVIALNVPGLDAERHLVKWIPRGASELI